MMVAIVNLAHPKATKLIEDLVSDRNEAEEVRLRSVGYESIVQILPYRGWSSNIRPNAP
jgi:hypothetical protein